MEARTEKHSWSSVPEFGGWDQKGKGDNTDYSVVFDRARANRRHHKSDFGCVSLGNEKELMDAYRQSDQNMRPKNKKILTYFKACIRPGI